jgi:hypothetical protein
MTRQQLADRRDKAVKAMEALKKKLETEKRPMTPDEKRQFKQYELEAVESKQLIAKMDKQYKAESASTAAAIKNLNTSTKE